MFTLSLTLLLGRGGWSVPCFSHFVPLGKSPPTHYMETGWTLGLVWMGVKDLSHTAVQTLHFPACSDLL